MILAIDTGNTHTVLGCIDVSKKRLSAAPVLRMRTDRAQTETEYAVRIRQILDLYGIDAGAFEGAILASVVPELTGVLAEAVRLITGAQPLIVGPGLKTGLKIELDDPGTIAADLVATAVAAKEEYPRPCVVIDMGTATTIDVVTKGKEYLGGAIMPGLKISMQALASGTAKLPTVEIVRPNRICGQSTIEAIQSGIFYGNAGSIKEICYQYQKQIFRGERTLVVGTGGFARTFEEYGLFDEIVPELVLLGVKNALEMNR